MTQQEQILTQLARSHGGLTANVLHDRTKIPKASLGTLIWELKRASLIRTVGGARGSWVYGLTEKGRQSLPDAEKDPLTRLAHAARGLDGGKDGTFKELLAVVDNIDDVRLLRRFVGWLVVSCPRLLTDELDTDRLTSDLFNAALEFLGIDTKAYQQQRESLEALVALV